MAVEQRVSTLEALVAQVAEQQIKTERTVDRLSEEMIGFKDDIREDTRVFKDEIREDTRMFKEQIHEDTRIFKEQICEDTRIFKEEIREDTRIFREQTREDLRVFEDRMATSRDELNEMWGNLANKMGTLVEDIISPNVRGVAEKYFGVHSLGPLTVGCHRKMGDDPRSEREFDVVASSDSHVFVAEVKTTPGQGHAKGFVALLPRLPEYFPDARGKELVPIFSALKMPHDVVTYLTRHGVYCMVMGGGAMVLANFDEVQARRRIT